MGATEGLTRRRMLQLTGIAGVAGAAALAGCKKEEGGEGGEPVTYTWNVYDPTGVVEVSQHFTARLDGIDGKTIAFVCDSLWEDDRTFALIKEILETKYTGVTVIDQYNFPTSVQEITVENNGIAEKMKEMGVDGAILGNAG